LAQVSSPKAWRCLRSSRKLPKIPILAVLYAALAVGCCAQSGSNTAPIRSNGTSSPVEAIASLPGVFASALTKVKAKSRIAVLLPGGFSQPLAKARYAIVEKASTGDYAISLYYKLGIGDAGFAALFAAEAHPGYEPQELGNVREVKLPHGLVGYFRPVSCGGSCTPANLWWEENQILYQIQLVLSPALREDDQQKAVLVIVNSAILAGPR
jgi:hypothetical protein